MNDLLKRMLCGAGYMDAAGEGTGGGGGGSSDDAAAKAAAEAAAAEAEAAAALAAQGGTDGGKGGSKDDSGAKKPTDEEAKLIREVMDKKTKLKEANDKLATLEAKVKQFDGIDIDGVRELLANKQAEETRKLEEKGQWDSLKKQMVEGHDKEKGALAAQVSERDAEVVKLKSKIGELTVGNAFSSSAFIKEELVAPAKARALFGSHFEFDENGVVAYDKPVGSADRNILVDAKGEPLSFEAAIKKIVEADPDSDQLLKSKVKTGAGSKTTSKSKTPEQKIDQPTGKDRIAAALSKGALVKK